MPASYTNQAIIRNLVVTEGARDVLEVIAAQCKLEAEEAIREGFTFEWIPEYIELSRMLTEYLNR